MLESAWITLSILCRALPPPPDPGRDLLGFGEGPDAAPLGAGFGLEVVEGEVDDVFVVDPGGAEADQFGADV